MSSKEVELHQSTALALAPEQTSFNELQRAALEHLGVQHAQPADLDVFFHVVKRTGLDPFARQIYMIGRNQREMVDGQWRTVVKQTIQTGIDGYRLIGRRAANAAGATLSVKPVQWASREGDWRDVWAKEWGTPLGARVTIVRSGEEFTAVALFDEYKQTKQDGELTAMWKQRPAGQIAKCAEALAWRMAFPQDLSGLYVDEELQHADAPQVVRAQVNGSAKDAVRAAVSAPGEAQDAEQPAGDPDDQPAADDVTQGNVKLITQQQSKLLHKSFNDLGMSDKPLRMEYTCRVIGRQIESSNELTTKEAGKVIDALLADLNPPAEPDETAPADEVETVEGETMDELDELRDDILKTAEAKGRTLEDVEQAFGDQYDGMSYYHADAEQLVKFHSWVKRQRKA